MFALARLLVVGFVVLTIVYLCLWLYGRASEKARLRQAWRDQGEDGDREAFVDQGMEQYEGSLRRKLIWGVYVVPTLIVVTIIYLTNFA